MDIDFPEVDDTPYEIVRRRVKFMELFDGCYAAFCHGYEGVGSSFEAALKDLTDQAKEDYHKVETHYD